MSEPLIGTGGDADIDEADEYVLFDASFNGGPCNGFYVENRDPSIELKVRIVGMHIDRTGSGGTDGMAILGPGKDKLFVWGEDHNGITQVLAKASTSGTITVRGFVQSRR